MPTNPECTSIQQQIDQTETQIRNLKPTSTPEAGQLAHLAAVLQALNKQATALGCYATPPTPIQTIGSTLTLTASGQTSKFKQQPDGDFFGPQSVTPAPTIEFQRWFAGNPYIVTTGRFSVSLGSNGAGGQITLDGSPADGSFSAANGSFSLSLPFVVQFGILDQSSSGTITLSSGMTLTAPGPTTYAGSNVDSKGNFALVGTTDIGLPSLVAYVAGVSSITVWLKLAGQLSVVPAK